MIVVNFATLFLVLIFIGLSSALATLAGSEGIAEPLCDVSTPIPYLLVNTDQGQLTIELFESAAPRTARWLVDLAGGSQSEVDVVGHYDGLSFDHTQPRIEIRTAIRPSPQPLTIKKEINAEALALDKKVISSIREASLVLQMELIKSRRRGKRTSEPNVQLSAWTEEWRRTNSPEFLIGVSRKRINEVLGHEYQQGIASQPIERGTVTLRPASPRLSTSQLSISLVDRPDRTGQWVAIGQVKSGLELADAISSRPLVATKLQPFTPRSPVGIQSVRFECRRVESENQNGRNI